MNTLKNLFCAAAMGLGGTGLTVCGLGLATGGFTSDMVDLTPVAYAVTAASAGMFYLGYKGLTNQPPKP